MQLTTKTYVVLDKQLADSCRSENQHEQEEQKQERETEEISQESSSPQTEDSWQVRNYKCNTNSILLVRNRPNNTEKEEKMYNSLRQRRKLKRKRDKINRIREKVRCIFQDNIISPNKSESDEDRRIISECLARRRLEFASNNSEFNDTLNDVTTEEEAEDIYEMIKIRKRKRDMSANNNLQDGTESVASKKSESVNSSDSTICIENDRLHDFTDDEETDCNSDKTSTRKRNASVDTSQKDIGIPMKIQRTENSSVIVNITAVINQSDAGRSEVVNITQHDSQENQDNVKNVNLADTDMKISTDISPNLLATKEVNMQDTQKNVTSAEDVKIPKDIRPNLTLATKEVKKQENQDKKGNINLAEEDLKDIRSNLSSMVMQELISSIKENDGCDVSKNITTENDEAITKIVNVSIRNLDKDSTNKKPVSDIVSSKISDSSDNHSSTDDDNMSDIEVEIKIKPKSKSRISRKFSLKAPLSAVNSCFKNLNTLKKNPDFLGELFQMNFKTPSENLKHGNTNEENGTKNTSEKSSDVNQNITAEAVSNTQEVTCNSSHTRKDNAELSSSQQQEQSTQNNTILDKDKNETQSEGANIHVQSDQQTPVTDENNSESPTSDKEKTADEQQKNPPKVLLVDLENGEMTELNQEAFNAERIKRRETAAEIDVESTKSVPESQKQLPKTSSETSDAKCSGEVQVRTNAELGYMWSSNLINLSMNSDASNGAHSMPSASSIYKPPPLYNSAANPAHLPPTTNVPAGVPTEIIPPNLDGKSSTNIVGQIYFNFHICRKIIEEGIFSEKRMYDFKICLYRIYEDIRTLKMMLHMTNNDDIINFINQYKLSTLPLSTNELAQYATLFKNYSSSYMGYSNVPPQPPTDNNSVQSAPIPNAQAPQPPFSGNIQGAPVPGATSRTQPSAVRTGESSAVPQPGPNINQSQFLRSTVNPLHSRLSSQSFCPQVPPTNIPVPNPATNPMINLQQPMRNANYVQGQRISSMFTVNNNQQPFVNPSTGLHAPMAPPSALNTNNKRTYRRNINVSSANAKKYQPNVLPKSTTAAAPATNMQQQMHQLPYSQTLFHMNSGTSHLLTMNQNANVLQNVYYVNQPTVHTNISIPTNATGNLVGNIGLVNPPVNPQMQSPITPAGKNVPQYNVNVQNNFTSQSAYNQNILLIQNQQQQNFSHLNLPTVTSIHVIDTKNNVSQNAQPSMPNKRPAGIPETQTKDCVPNKKLFTKPQRDAHQQGAASVHNVSQEPFVQILPKTSVSQKPSVSQNATSHTVSQTDKTILISQTNPVAPSNKFVVPHFDVSSWTTRDQIRCRNQLHYYLEYCLNKQSNSETLRLENKMLIFFYTYLKNVFKLMKEMDVSEKASTVPNRLSVIRSSCSEIQSNNNSQSNENNLICDKVQEKEPLEGSINPDASINSKSTVGADSAMKTQNVESSHLQSTSRSITPNQIENSYSQITNLLKENTSQPLKMRLKMNSASTVGKQSENIKTSSAESPNISKENSNAETSRGVSETKAQDDKTARPLAENSQPSKSSSLDVSQETLNLLQKMCAKVTDNRTISNDDTKDKGTGKSPNKDQNDKRLSESSSSPAQNTLNLLQNDETKDNVEGSDNARTSNLCNISNVTISNSSGGNEKAASQVPCNAEVQDKEVDNEISMCNVNNKIPDENSQNKTRENVQENSEKSIFTDTPRASSTPFILDETSGLLIPTNRTSESISQTFTFEPDLFTREDPANEQTNDSGKTHDDSFESLGRLHIDESAEKSEEEQDDRESSSGKDKPNTSQDSCFHEVNRESAEMTSFVDDYEASLLTVEENRRKVKKNLSLKEMQTAEKTPDVPEDISNTRASTSLEQSINTVEGTKENQSQMDTHSNVRAINELFKHVSDDNKHCAKPRTSPTKKSNVYKAKIYETAVLLDKNVTSNVSPAKSEDENSGVTLNITNVSSIPPSLFEEINNEVFQDLNYTLIEMKEKDLLDENDNSEVTDSVLLNEMNEEQPSDNPEVLKSESLNEVIGEKSPDVNDTPEIFPVLLHEIQIKENLEVPFILNELEKEEQLDNPDVFVDINDRTEIFDSTPFEEVKIKESWFMDENPKDQHIWKNKVEEEKLLDNPEVDDNVIWFKQEEDQSLNVRTPEIPDTTSDDMEKEKLSNINDGPEESDEIEDRPCLRCERKSTVYCQACLKAPYCSKRCQRLNWVSKHHRECNGRYKSANQPDQIVCID